MRKTSKKGQGLVEYVLIISLIAVVCIALLSSVGETVRDGLWDKVADKLQTTSSNLESSGS
ncbi:MAG TPA: Flp family type IVb pilin [Candidatus Ozemobacteraceae bacterium]|nr:Flp family type IVb pilin [Candidatus Ozemobacteraceae bacterium]